MVICNCRETYYKTKSATLGWPSEESLVSHTYLYIYSEKQLKDISLQFYPLHEKSVLLKFIRGCK